MFLLSFLLTLLYIILSLEPMKKLLFHIMSFTPYNNEYVILLITSLLFFISTFFILRFKMKLPSSSISDTPVIKTDNEKLKELTSS